MCVCRQAKRSWKLEAFSFTEALTEEREREIESLDWQMHTAFRAAHTDSWVTWSVCKMWFLVCWYVNFYSLQKADFCKRYSFLVMTSWLTSKLLLFLFFCVLIFICIKPNKKQIYSISKNQLKVNVEHSSLQISADKMISQIVLPHRSVWLFSHAQTKTDRAIKVQLACHIYRRPCMIAHTHIYISLRGL